jgi:hypothetical protein
LRAGLERTSGLLNSRRQRLSNEVGDLEVRGSPSTTVDATVQPVETSIGPTGGGGGLGCTAGTTVSGRHLDDASTGDVVRSTRVGLVVIATGGGFFFLGRGSGGSLLGGGCRGLGRSRGRCGLVNYVVGSGSGSFLLLVCASLGVVLAFERGGGSALSKLSMASGQGKILVGIDSADDSKGAKEGKKGGYSLHEEKSDWKKREERRWW